MITQRRDFSFPSGSDFTMPFTFNDSLNGKTVQLFLSRSTYQTAHIRMTNEAPGDVQQLSFTLTPALIAPFTSPQKWWYEVWVVDAAAKRSRAYVGELHLYSTIRT